MATASVLNCGEAIATRADSGNPDHKKIVGELGFVGAAYDEFEGIKMAFAFSGALSEEDLLVSQTTNVILIFMEPKKHLMRLLVTE